MSNETTDPDVEKLRAAGTLALGDLFASYRQRLERMIEFRIDQRLRGRVDPADVLQDAFIEISRRLDSFLENPQVSFFVWIRQMTLQALINLHRRHFRDKRSVKQEVQLHRRSSPDATSYSIACAALEHQTSPSRAAVREEEIDQLRTALESMDEIDREVLALRHFEHLSNNEVAETLALSVTAASNRYVRAMARLGTIMETLDK